MEQEKMNPEYEIQDLGDNVLCVNCNTELPMETKFKCLVCGKRIKFRYLSSRLQTQIISLWIGFPLTVMFFFMTVGDWAVGGFFDEIWILFGLTMQIITYLFGIQWIIQEFRFKKRAWWRIILGFLMFILELYFMVFSSIFVFEIFGFGFM
jgi:predicted RNA-binding Zn-ribbon protein involved in translation (DUF1610 family)